MSHFVSRSATEPAEYGCTPNKYCAQPCAFESTLTRCPGVELPVSRTLHLKDWACFRAHVICAQQGFHLMPCVRSATCHGIPALLACCQAGSPDLLRHWVEVHTDCLRDWLRTAATKVCPSAATASLPTAPLTCLSFGALAFRGEPCIFLMPAVVAADPAPAKSAVAYSYKFASCVLAKVPSVAYAQGRSTCHPGTQGQVAAGCLQRPFVAQSPFDCLASSLEVFCRTALLLYLLSMLHLFLIFGGSLAQPESG